MSLSPTHRRGLAGAVAAPLLLAAAVAAAAPAEGTWVSFVACPIARDTGPEVDLCFLAEHDGQAYALVNPSDWGTPQLKHRVLVEGRVRTGPPVCGATPLDARITVFKELDLTCDTVLPFDGVIKGVAGGVFNSGPPEARAAAQDLARRAVADPRLSIQPVMADPPPPPAPTGPFTARDLTVFYPFESDRGSGPDMLEVMKLADYARAAGKGRLIVTGYQAKTRLDDRSVLTEPADMARSRAQKMAGILAGLGVPADRLDVRWIEKTPAPTGREDWRGRRVELKFTPG